MKSIDIYELVTASRFSYSDYKIVDCHPATGILYLKNKFLSGHVRMRGKDNGRYPYAYKEMIHSIFGVANNAIEVCSNAIQDDTCLTTVDIRRETNPNCVADGQLMQMLEKQQ